MRPVYDYRSGSVFTGQSKTDERWLSLNQQSDEELASAVMADDADALAVLFDRYHRLVYGVAKRIIQDAGEAEEVVQIVFLDFYRARANFDPAKGILKVWLLQYAYHRALHRKRHLAAQRFYKWVDVDGANPPLEWTHPESVEVARLLDELLSRLNPRRRTVIELTYVEGLTAEEVALRMNISVNVARRELYRGLADLRTAIGKAGTAKTERAVPGKEARHAGAPAI